MNFYTVPFKLVRYIWNKVLDVAFGAEEDFEYRSTTTINRSIEVNTELNVMDRARFLVAATHIEMDQEDAGEEVGWTEDDVEEYIENDWDDQLELLSKRVADRLCMEEEVRG